MYKSVACQYYINVFVCKDVCVIESERAMLTSDTHGHVEGFKPISPSDRGEHIKKANRRVEKNFSPQSKLHYSSCNELFHLFSQTALFFFIPPRVNLTVFCIYRPYFIGLRYSLGGNLSWPSVPLQLASTGVNDAANISRYTNDATPSSTCETSNTVSLTLPELTPGMSDIGRFVQFCFESRLQMGFQ